MVTRFPSQDDVDEMRRNAEALPDGQERIEALRRVDILQEWVTERAANPPAYDDSED